MDEERSFEMIWDRVLDDESELADRYAAFYNRVCNTGVWMNHAVQMTTALIRAEQTRFPELLPELPEIEQN